MARSNRDQSPLRAVSLFSNCGAGDLGFAAAGFQFEVMGELEQRRLDVAKLNHRRVHTVAGDLRKTLPDVVAAYCQRAGDERPALLAACPPCQGMSSARSTRGSEHDPAAGSADDRNLLVQVIVDAVEGLRPRAVVVENVQAFLTRKVWHPTTRLPVSAASILIDALADTYACYPGLLDLADFGVPQTRKRAFLTFIAHDEPAVTRLDEAGRVPYPLTRPRISLRDSLVNLDAPPLSAATASTSHRGSPLHTVPVWDDARLPMVQAIPVNSGRSAWENDDCLACGATGIDAAAAQCPDCGAVLPRPVRRDKYGRLRLVRGFNTSYRRMDPDVPAATVTTASGHVGSDRTIHPWEDRVLSMLECAHLQTFPPTFKWGDTLKRWGHTNLRAMIGEAVPPLFTRRHGWVIRRLLEDGNPRMLRAGDPRIARAEAAIARGRLIHSTTV